MCENKALCGEFLSVNLSDFSREIYGVLKRKFSSVNLRENSSKISSIFSRKFNEFSHKISSEIHRVLKLKFYANLFKNLSVNLREFSSKISSIFLRKFSKFSHEISSEICGVFERNFSSINSPKISSKFSRSNPLKSRLTNE